MALRQGEAKSVTTAAEKFYLIVGRFAAHHNTLSCSVSYLLESWVFSSGEINLFRTSLCRDYSECDIAFSLGKIMDEPKVESEVEIFRLA